MFKLVIIKNLMSRTPPKNTTSQKQSMNSRIKNNNKLFQSALNAEAHIFCVFKAYLPIIVLASNAL